MPLSQYHVWLHNNYSNGKDGGKKQQIVKTEKKNYDDFQLWFNEFQIEVCYALYIV